MSHLTQAQRATTEAHGYTNLVRDLVKNSGIYAISSLASPLVALVLAPFLTHALSAADYGALVVLNTIIALLTGITQLGMISAVFRAYNYDYDDVQDRLKVLATTVLLLFLTSLPLVLVFFMAAPWLASLLLGNTSFSDSIKVTAIVILIQNLSVPGLAWLRAEKRAASFSALSILNLLVTLGANILLVGVLHMQIAGALFAIGAGYACILLCTLPLILIRAGLIPRLAIMQNLLSFGVPLVFNTVSFWVLQLSDRYLLSRLGSLAQTGSYGVAYNLGGALNVVVLTPFVLAWPSTMFAVARKEDAPQIFRHIFRWFSLVLLLVGFALALFAEVVLDELFPPAYQSAAPIIPIITVSIVFYGVYTIFTVGAGVKRKNWYIALIMTFAALVNVAANFVLIPLYGSLGAALSTLIAYVLLTVVMYVVNQCIYPLPFQTGVFFFALLVGIALYYVSSRLGALQIAYDRYAIYIAFTIFYGVCLVLLEKLAARRCVSPKK